MEGGGGGGWWRQKVAEVEGVEGRRWRCILAVSSMYPHCILTASLQREVSAESCDVRRWWVVVAAMVEGGKGGGWWSMTLYPHCIPLYPHCIPTVSSLYPHCFPPQRGVCGVLRHRKVVGGGCSNGGGWQRWRAAEYDAVSSLYPHCILTVSSQREVEGGGWWRQWWKVEG